MCLCMCFSSLKRLSCVVVFRAEGLQEAYSCCHVDGACKYHRTVSHPSTSGRRSVFANVNLMLKTSWHDPDRLPVTPMHVFARVENSRVMIMAELEEFDTDTAQSAPLRC